MADTEILKRNDALIRLAQGGDSKKKKSSSPGQLPVYLGQTQDRSNYTAADEMAGRAGRGGPKVMKDRTSTVEEVAGSYYSWDNGQKNKFVTQLALAGYDVENMRDAQLAQLWGGYVQQASTYFSNGKKLTPWDMLAKDRQQREAYMNTPRSETTTSTSTDLSTFEDARAVMYEVARSLLGRAPTKTESKQIQSVLNSYEKANPTVTTTTTNYMGDTVTGQESKTSGGVRAETRQMLAMDEAKKDPEYGAYQAATNGMNWLQELIRTG